MKKSFDINEFGGLVNNVDKKDIPDNSASEINNVDPTGLGDLKGIMLATTLSTSSGVGFKLGSWIERDDNKKDLVFGTATNIHALTDFYGTLGLSASLATSSASTMVSDAKSVHIGTTTTPKWVGNIDATQLGSSYGEGLNILEANIARPYTIPVLKKIVTDGTNYYAITGSGSTIYKWTSLSSNYVESSNVFEEIQSIVYCDDYLWAITKENDLYYLCKIDPSDYAILQVSLLDGIAIDFYDLGFTTNKFFLVPNTGTAPIVVDSANIPFVYSCDKPTDNTAITLTNASPNDQQYQGAWDAVGAIIEPFAIVSLQQADAIGVLARIILPSLSFFSFDFAGGEEKEIASNVIFLIGENATYSATSKWADMSSSYTAKYDVILVDNDIDSISTFATDGTNAHWVFQSISGGDVTATEFIYLSGGIGTALGAFTYGVAHSETLPGYLYATHTPQAIDVGNKLLYLCDNSGLVYVSGSNNGELGDVSESAGVYTIDNRYSSDVELIVNYNADDSAYIDATDYQYFAVSYIYDNLQESPLSEYTLLDDSPVAKNVNVKVNIANYDAFNNILNNRRLTGLNLYSATGKDTLSPDTLFRLVETLDLTEHWVITTDTYNNQVYSKSIVYEGLPGATYEANTGFPQNITDITPTYQVSCELNNSLFIGNCTHPKLDDASHTIFKSKSFRYDSFDWINEGLKIPFVPKAMFGYAGRLWVFDANRFLRVNPELYVEDTIEGIGCTNHLCWVVTDYGAFWCDSIGAYMNIDGSTTKISEPVVWTARDRVIFDAQYNMVMFYSANDVLAYSPLRKRWDNYTSIVAGTVTGAFTGINGETYTAHTTLDKNFGGTIRRALTWVSKEFTFDNPSQFKYFYRAICDYTNGGDATTTVTYAINGSSTWRPLETLGTVTDAILNDDDKWYKGQSIMVKIVTTGTTGDALIRSLSIIYRELVIK